MLRRLLPAALSGPAHSPWFVCGDLNALPLRGVAFDLVWSNLVLQWINDLPRAFAETRQQRAGLIAQLANLDPYPESVPINHLVQVEGTPLHAKLHGQAALDPLEFVRTIAVARITMPKAMVRLSAGRRELGEAIQALCFVAGANSIFYGDRLLTTGNPDVDADRALFAKLGLTPLA